MTVNVTRDTTIEKTDEKLFLFQLQGAPVTVTLRPEKGEHGSPECGDEALKSNS